jgi:hypothetical protein
VRDLALTLAVIVAFAGLVTAHVTIAIGLLRRPERRWRAPLALVLPPLAPYFAVGARMWVRASIWVACLGGYGITRWLGSM